ncbi:Carboxylesterase NlhH [Mycobacterium shottsii]|uniref:Putative esterase LipW n=1 Tax=Mycobacterium shottsii TaxID=133549 RepID=A0A7I7LGR1_9MYCO|nr:alpha/beta hydrolase [Mycobacterium shottsii]QYL28564.1 Carboxylesterase NlhH [Mycobacterium shottsii]BBX58569.1 putative esterase LipW [Mycobacterium shottsii]
MQARSDGPPAFTKPDAIDPALRAISRILPRGYGLHRGLKLPRALMKLAGITGRLRDVPVVAVNDEVSVRLHRPAGLPDPGPALLWIHGGGTVMGSAAQEDQYCRKLSHLAGVAVAAVDYRLAPEHPYPTPVEDCYAALLWLRQQPWVDPSRIAVAGASAGVLFAATLVQLACDRGHVEPVLQMLVYPMLDDRTGSGPNGHKRIIWSERDNQQAWQLYLAGADPSTAAPARRADLSNLPPAWIGVGTLDLFHQECLDYAARLRDAGVEVHEQIADGAFHAFDLLAPNAPVSLGFFASQCQFLRTHLHASVSDQPQAP